MMNHVFLATVTAAALTLSDTQVSLAQTLFYDFTVDVTSGPLTGERYTGITSVDLTNLPEDNDEIVKSPSITFDFGGVNFTDANDVQDVDANSPRANFQDGNFIGNTYIVSRFGRRPTDIPLIKDVSLDGFAIDNSDFGYVVGANFYTGKVSYSLPPNVNKQNANEPDAQPVPEPSLWFGLAAIVCSCACSHHGRRLTRHGD
ncbi:MAG: hypothetical protein AAF243_04745 [Cyanobacteria bacterium P01_A01_bin.137]